MKRKTLSRGIEILVFFLIISIYGTSNVFAYNTTGNFCECNSCKDCTDALNDNSCTIVGLTQDISNYDGTCIDSPTGFNNKIFDCQGHKIGGDDSGEDYGIYMEGKSNNTIKNCRVTDFHDGIYLENSRSNLITNNTANSNGHYDNSNKGYGIHLSNSGDNLVHNNTANSNGLAGIRLEGSNNNTISNNFCSLNLDFDGIYMTDSSYNNIINNLLTMNDDSGLWIYSCTNNYIFNNTITLNGKINGSSPIGYGLYLIDSPDNAIKENVFCDNLNSDVYSDNGSSIGCYFNRKYNGSCRNLH